MGADATGAARPDELLDVQRALEDRGDHRGVVPGEEAAGPRLHAEVAELLERPAMGRRGLLQAHRMLRDQIDRRDAEAPRLDPPDRLDRDPMVALAGGQKEDELVGREAIIERGHERDGGLPEAGRGVGEQMLALGQTPAGIDEEIRLPVSDPVEGPRHAGGRRTEGRQRFATLHEDHETTSPSGAEDMKDFPRERAETTPVAIGGTHLRGSAYAAGRGSLLSWPAIASSAGSSPATASARGAIRSCDRIEPPAAAAGRPSTAGSRPATRAARRPSRSRMDPELAKR